VDNYFAHVIVPVEVMYITKGFGAEVTEIISELELVPPTMKFPEESQSNAKYFVSPLVPPSIKGKVRSLEF
jgi:hypothetical protein